MNLFYIVFYWQLPPISRNHSTRERIALKFWTVLNCTRKSKKSHGSRGAIFYEESLKDFDWTGTRYISVTVILQNYFLFFGPFILLALFVVVAIFAGRDTSLTKVGKPAFPSFTSGRISLHYYYTSISSSSSIFVFAKEFCIFRLILCTFFFHDQNVLDTRRL